MATELLYIRSGLAIREHVATYTIRTGPGWNLWAPQPTLFLESLTHTCGGTIGQAILKQEFGRMARSAATAGAGSYTLEAPLDLVNEWVEIEYRPPRLEVDLLSDITSPFEGLVAFERNSSTLARYDGAGWVAPLDIAEKYYWYGIIVEDSMEYFGNEAGGDAGDMTFRAYSLETLFKKKTIEAMYVWDTGGTSRKVTGRSVAFNAGRAGDSRSTTDLQFANRTAFTDGPTNAQGRTVFDFANSLSSLPTPRAEQWTALQMLDYICAHFSPFSTSLPIVEVRADPPLLSFLDTVKPTNVQIDGRTVLDVINQIVDRRRGITWYFDPSIANDEITLRVVSYADQDLTLPSGAILPGNPNQYRLDWSENTDAETQMIESNNITRYSQVVVTGAPQGAVFTVGAQDGNLIPDWEGQDEIDYNAGFSNDPSYAAIADASDKESANDSVRSSERLNHVFTRFAFPFDWDGFAHWGDRIGQVNDVLNSPAFPDTGNSPTGIPTADTIGGGVGATDQHEYWQPGMRVQNYLPLKVGFDYSSTAATVPNQNLAESYPEFRKPFLALNLNAAPTTAPAFYVHGDRATQVLKANEKENEVNFSASIGPASEQLGIQCKTSELPHSMGVGTETYFLREPIPYPPQFTNHPPSQLKQVLIPYTEMMATVYVQCDTPVMMKHPDIPTAGYADTTPILTIRLGDRAYLDWLLPGTVVDVDLNGKLIRSKSNQASLEPPQLTYRALRDDRVAMRDLAQLAFAWYGAQRVVIEVAHNQVVGDYQVGRLVDEITTVAVGQMLAGQNGEEVVGQGTGTNVQGQGGQSFTVNTLVTRVTHDFRSMTTRMNTEFAELDFAGLF